MARSRPLKRPSLDDLVGIFSNAEGTVPRSPAWNEANAAILADLGRTIKQPTKTIQLLVVYCEDRAGEQRELWTAKEEEGRTEHAAHEKLQFERMEAFTEQVNSLANEEGAMGGSLVVSGVEVPSEIHALIAHAMSSWCTGNIPSQVLDEIRIKDFKKRECQYREVASRARCILQGMKQD